MNISFHYFLVKTLADKAFDNEDMAQEIAYYSQLIDDYILCDTYIQLPKECKPPAFFFTHGLAKENKNIFNKTIGWKFYPANPGIPEGYIDMLTSLTVSQETYTFTPFHFIPPKSLTEMNKAKHNRYNYQCEKAGTGKYLIDHLIKDFRKMEPMQLGMLLHTYADTYAHEKFSGFDMAENNVIMDDIEDRSSGKPRNVSFNIAYNNVPAIGHARLAHVPDAFALWFKYHYKDGRETVGRYNMEFFMECARKIADILYQYNGKEVLSDSEWKKIEDNLIRAGNDCVNVSTEYTDFGTLKNKWTKYFPEVSYWYDKEGEVSAELEPTEAVGAEELPDDEVLPYGDSQAGGEEDMETQITILHPAYTPKNEELFFKFHQYAYEHIYAVTGKYRQEVF